MDAEAEAAKAEATETITVAVEARIAAEAARDVAVAAEMEASTLADAAEMAAMSQLKIDGMVKSVGETTLDAEAGLQQGDHQRKDGETGEIPERLGPPRPRSTRGPDRDVEFDDGTKYGTRTTKPRRRVRPRSARRLTRPMTWPA